MSSRNEQELQMRIDRFLTERYAKHPELNTVTIPEMAPSTRATIVSRVKKFTTKFTQMTSLTLYHS